MKVSDLVTRFEKMEEKFSTILSRGKSPDGNAEKEFASEMVRELASFKKEIASLSKDDEIKDIVKKELATLIESGQVIEKSKAEADLEAAKKELESKFRAEQDAIAKKQSRIDEITKLGISLEANPWDDQPTVSIKDRVASFPMDDIGDQLFKAELRFLTILAEKEKEDTEAKAEQERLKNASPSATAASTKASTRKPLLVGASPETPQAKEVASTGGKLFGRSRILSMTKGK